MVWLGEMLQAKRTWVRFGSRLSRVNDTDCDVVGPKFNKKKSFVEERRTDWSWALAFYEFSSTGSFTMNSVGTRRKHVLYFIRVSLLRHVTDLQDGDCDSSHFYEKQQMVGACFLCWLLTWRPSLGSYNLADLRQLLNYAKVTVFVILSSSGDTSFNDVVY